MMLHEDEEKSRRFNLGSNICRVLHLLGKNLNLLVLVVIWAYTNTICFRAVALVGAPTYSVVIQSKIFFTAGFGVLFMSRKYSFTKWRALILLVIGCILVSSPILLPKVEAPEALPCQTMESTYSPMQYNNTNITASDIHRHLNLNRAARRLLRGGSYAYVNSNNSMPIVRSLSEDDHSSTRINPTAAATTTSVPASTSSTSLHQESKKDEITPMDSILGLSITLSVAVCSGFTSVYFEKILKGGPAGSKSTAASPTTIWDRNFQLAFYSIIFTFFIAMYQQYYTIVAESSTPSATTAVENVPMFAGWSWVTVLICVINSLGGFLVAATLKYADAISKCFASSVSIILTTIIGYVFLGSEIDFFSGLGMLTTILSVLNYTLVDVE